MISERKKGVSHQVTKSEWVGSTEMLELYCDSLSKESAVWRNVREGFEGNVGAEVGGVRDARWNRVSPDIYPPLQGSGVLTWQKVKKGKMGWSQRLQFWCNRVLLGVSGGSPLPVPGHGCYPKVPMSYVLFQTPPIWLGSVVFSSSFCYPTLLLQPILLLYLWSPGVEEDVGDGFQLDQLGLGSVLLCWTLGEVCSLTEEVGVGMHHCQLPWLWGKDPVCNVTVSWKVYWCVQWLPKLPQCLHVLQRFKYCASMSE